MQKRVVILVVLLLAAVGAAAAADNAFEGIWKLNVAKSTATPGPMPKSETLTIGPGPKVSVQEVTADGREVSWGYTVSGDTPAKITGMEDSTVVERRPDDRTVEHEWKMGNATMTGRGVLSKGGKKMTYTLKGTNGKGQPVNEVLFFEKQ